MGQGLSQTNAEAFWPQQVPVPQRDLRQGTGGRFCPCGSVLPLTTGTSSEPCCISFPRNVLIPDLEKARSLLIGGKWTAIGSAVELEYGWIKLSVPSGLMVNVRAKSIEAVRYSDAAPVEMPANFAFDLGRSWKTCSLPASRIPIGYMHSRCKCGGLQGPQSPS